jgi:hypothetical protein
MIHDKCIWCQANDEVCQIIAGREEAICADCLNILTLNSIEYEEIDIETIEIILRRFILNVIIYKTFNTSERMLDDSTH